MLYQLKHTHQHTSTCMLMRTNSSKVNAQALLFLLFLSFFSFSRWGGETDRESYIIFTSLWYAKTENFITKLLSTTITIALSWCAVPTKQSSNDDNNKSENLTWQVSLPAFLFCVPRPASSFLFLPICRQQHKAYFFHNKIVQNKQQEQNIE